MPGEVVSTEDAFAEASLQRQTRRMNVLAQIFMRLDDEPIASASIAQVHRARVKDTPEGQEVAIKLQHHGAKERMLGDIAQLRLTAALLSRLGVSFRVDVASVLRAYTTVLEGEFDFVKEVSVAPGAHTVGGMLQDLPSSILQDLPSVSCVDTLRNSRCASSTVTLRRWWQEPATGLVIFRLDLTDMCI